MSAATTVTYAQIRGEQYANVRELAEVLRAHGQHEAARLLEESAQGPALRQWKVKP